MTERSMIAYALAGIAMIFLSLAVPVHAMGRAVAIEVAMEREDVMMNFVDNSRVPQEPVLYTDFDISKELEPWQDIMITQLALWTYDRQEQIAKQAELLGMPPDFGGWAANSVGLAMLCIGLFSMFIAVLWYSDKVKRKRA